jgi:hypothetical protein
MEGGCGGDGDGDLVGEWFVARRTQHIACQNDISAWPYLLSIASNWLMFCWLQTTDSRGSSR